MFQLSSTSEQNYLVLRCVSPAVSFPEPGTFLISVEASHSFPTPLYIPPGLGVWGRKRRCMVKALQDGIDAFAAIAEEPHEDSSAFEVDLPPSFQSRPGHSHNPTYLRGTKVLKSAHETRPWLAHRLTLLSENTLYLRIHMHKSSMVATSHHVA